MMAHLVHHVVITLVPKWLKGCLGCTKNPSHTSIQVRKLFNYRIQHWMHLAKGKANVSPLETLSMVRIERESISTFINVKIYCRYLLLKEGTIEMKKVCLFVFAFGLCSHGRTSITYDSLFLLRWVALAIITQVIFLAQTLHLIWISFFNILLSSSSEFRRGKWVESSLADVHLIESCSEALGTSIFVTTKAEHI